MFREIVHYVMHPRSYKNIKFKLQGFSDSIFNIDIDSILPDLDLMEL